MIWKSAHSPPPNRRKIRYGRRTIQAPFLLILPLLLILLLAGCGGGGGSAPLAAADPPPGGGDPLPPPGPGPTATPIPTAPTGLPALTGFSTGFSAVLSPGMAAPPAPGALVAPLPQPTSGTIIDQDAAIRLGKALFWDMQTGSDGRIACASCHFQAGADNRITNTIHPGPNALFEVVDGPGANFTFATFDPLVSDDRVGSGGVISADFVAIATDPSIAADACTPTIHPDPAQAVLSNAGQRGVTGRNTPPAVGAVFYLDNFWDGRASQTFNGLNPLGDGVPVSGLSSLASQALGPPLDSVEMSCAGRTWNGPNSIGAKLVPRTPLANQHVHPQDSALGPLSNDPGNGLDCGFEDRLCTYADLIAAAFGTNGLAGQAAVDFYVNNFSVIWGQALQAYQATLVPDRTPYDLGTLTAAQVEGLQGMRTRGCMVCHIEPEFSDATVRLITLRGGTGVQKLVGGLPGGDQGFHNIGAATAAQDRGRAASPGGTYHVSVFNEGAFKTPGLRNVKLTAPYMHNGAVATIRGVIDFYNGTGQVQTDPGFNPAGNLSLGGDRDEAEDFMLNGLTDCRVEHKLAPFDHPSLEIPNGPNLPSVGRAGNGAICP